MTEKKNFWIDVVMLPLSLITIYPFLFVLFAALKTRREVTFNPFGMPQSATLDNFFKAFEDTPLLRVFFNNVLVTVISVTLLVLICSMAAYPVVYRRNRATRTTFYYLLCGLFIPFQTTLIPLFQVFQTLHLMDTLTGLILLYAAGVSLPFYMYVAYIKGLPMDLMDAALIDGCGVGRAFWSIIFPMSQPVTITVVIFTTFSTWNNFLAPNLFLKTRTKGTLILEVTRAFGKHSVDWGRTFAVVTVVILPLFFFYIMVQRNLIKGIATGGVKG